jgi:hypothetical protein
MELEIDLTGNFAKMNKVHKAGCRDLEEPMELGSHDTKESVYAELSGWGSNYVTDIELGLIKFAPCCGKVA